MMNDGDRAREEFFSEAQEIVEGLGRDLLALDEGQKSGHIDPDLIKEVFRAVHTIKGLAGLFGATRMATLSHDLESMLDDLRLGKIDLTPNVLDVLFASVQLYGRILQAEKEGRDQPMPEFDKLIAQLNRDSAQHGVTSGGPMIDPSLLAVLTEFEEHRLRTNISQGNTLYWLRVRFQVATIDQGLEELKATAKPHGEIITYLPAGVGDDIDFLGLDILMASRATSETLRAALAHLSVEVEELPRVSGSAAAPVSMPPPQAHVPPTPAPPPVSASASRPTPIPPVHVPHVDLDLTGAHLPYAPRIEPRIEIMPPGIQSAKAQELGTIKSVAQTVRVDIQKLDDLMTYVGELSIVRTELEQEIAKMRDGQASREDRSKLRRLQRDFLRNVDKLRDGILKVRMVPLSQVFDKLQRIARQISREAGKQVNPVITGKETEVDKLTIEELSDPLMHMMRNAIDHGIELPKDREAANKPVVGTIAINAFQKGNHVVIEIEDDGQGIDTDRLLEKAIAKGVVTQEEARTMSRREILNLIFVPGLSTKATVSEISGRGVGMDVVKTNISKLGGVIDVQSEPGINTKFTVTLPITQAIINALIVKVADQQFAIPLANVQDVGQLDSESVRIIDGREAVTWRGSATLQLCNLARLFGLAKPQEPDANAGAFDAPSLSSPEFSTPRLPPLRSDSLRHDATSAFPYRPARNSPVPIQSSSGRRKKRNYVVVISIGARRLGLVVDHLVRPQNVVIKGLGPSLKNVAGFTGATQLADQRIALVLDAASLIEEMFAHKGAALAHGGPHGF
ncbi:MAG: chemotaxis protein CheA [Polyangiaceae bacterium]|nr:chemotaxis protein CheA [Polyangiaceae bacterium]